MSIYYMNEAAFDLPDASFVDRTVTYLEGKAPSGVPVVLLVERAPFPEGKSLRQAVTDVVKDAKKRLRKYEVLFEREAEMADQVAIELGVRWRDDDGVVYTRQTHFVLGSTLMTVAGEVPLEEREFCDAYVDHVVESLRPRV
jgi:hypothetical protein